jgi:hypothetical protein
MSAAVRPVNEALVDRIYECAFTPEHWPEVFDELAKIADARGGFLFTANRTVINWTASASLQAGMQAFVAATFTQEAHDRLARSPAVTPGSCANMMSSPMMRWLMIPSIATYCGQLV